MAIEYMDLQLFVYQKQLVGGFNHLEK